MNQRSQYVCAENRLEKIHKSLIMLKEIIGSENSNTSEIFKAFHLTICFGYRRQTTTIC